MQKRPAGKDSGSQAEDAARRYLEKQGLRKLTCNYRCRSGEIDLVMEEGNTLVFVEVRYRSNPHYGIPAETVTREKQRRLSRAAEHYLNGRHNPLPRCRFDVVAISGSRMEHIDWIVDAFEPAG